MANPSRLEGDYYIAGDLSARTISFPDGTITDAKVAGSAGIAATKLNHQQRPFYSQPNTAATTETRALYVCRGASATVVDFRAGSIAAATGAATVTLDLRKNGATVLTAVVTLDNANAARVAETGTLSGTVTLVANDLLEVVITATAGGGVLPTGVFCSATINETPQ